MTIEVVEKCFPNYLKNEVEEVFKTLDLDSDHEPYMPFDIFFNQERLTIPQRIYSDEKQLEKAIHLSPMQQIIGFCLFTRHHNGFVREQSLRQILTTQEAFIIPFIIQLLGEYVVEIIELIYKNRNYLNKPVVNNFIKENPKYYHRTYQRVYSYWDCFYRQDYPKYKKHIKPNGKTVMDYPGVKMLKYINREIVQNVSNMYLSPKVKKK